MLIIGHRGAPSIKPENTLESFQAALDDNVDGIELDVQLTQDNELVVFHDFDTQKLNGKNYLIKDCTIEFLRKLTSDFKIAILQDVLNIIPKNKQLHIEVKSNTINNKLVALKIIELLTTYDLVSQTIISSFNPFVLSKFKALSPDIKLGLLWTKSPSVPWFVTHYSYYKIKPYSFHASIKYINQEIINWIKNKNMQLYCYTINDQKNLKKAQSFGVDGIFSDYPNILK